MTPRFSFYLVDRATTPIARIVSGPVQGAGGLFISYERLLGCARLSQEGRPHGLYEPAPGCVHVFPAFSALGNGDPVLVDLRQAVRVEPAGFSRGGP